MDRQSPGNETCPIGMRFVKCKPEYIWHLLSQTENLRRLYKKTPCKVLAIWMTEAGSNYELITLVQFASFADLEQHKEIRMTDPEWVKFDCMCAKFYISIEDRLCKCSVTFPKMMTIDPTKRYLIEMFRCNGFIPMCTEKLREINYTLGPKEFERECKTIGVLIPIMSKNPCIIVIREHPSDNTTMCTLNHYRDMLPITESTDKTTGTFSMIDTANLISCERTILVRGIPLEKAKENCCCE